MYKKILFYMMLAGSATRLVSAALLAMMDKINLPVLLVALSLFIAILGIALVIKSFRKKISLPELFLYHFIADIGAVFSFIVLHFNMVDISLIETLITGSVLSVLASATVLYLTFRKKRYITIRQQKEIAVQQKLHLTSKVTEK